jgi:uncharacterized glyoxalase superfamily protein PhnB
MATSYVPEGLHSVTPYLIVQGIPGLIEFLKQAFDATELHHTKRPDGKIGHAEVKIGDSVVMMGESMDGYPPMPAMLYLYVADVDAVYRRAVRAGGTSLEEPADQFYGDRRAGVKDACGNMWYIATHKEDVSDEEIQRRFAQMAKQREGTGG